MTFTDKLLVFFHRKLYNEYMLENVTDSIGEGKILLSVSGGKDSMALLHLFYSHEKFRGRIGVINFEHGIRGADSVADSEFVREWCRARNIPCRVVELKVLEDLKGETVEQCARRKRYEWYGKLLESGEWDYVATAHHMSDNVETLLLRIFRGTGTFGLRGIGERDRILRPFLRVERSEIDEYVRVNSVPFREDETNLDSTYSRNFIRNEVLPLVRTKYPRVEEAISRLCDSAAEDEAFFDGLIAGKIRFSGERAEISAADIRERALGNRIIRKAFRLLNVYADIEKRHTDLIVGLATERNGCVLDMPFGIKAAHEGDNIVIYRPTAKITDELPFPGGVLGSVRVSLTLADRVEKGGLFVDGAKIEGCVFRTKRAGDAFRRFGGGNKKLNDYLTDIKYPLSKRDSLVVLARGSEVMAVCGVEISEYAKVDSSTNIIYQILTEELNNEGVH